MDDDERFADFSKECDEVRRQMRAKVLALGDQDLHHLYYRALMLSEHEAGRRALGDGTLSKEMQQHLIGNTTIGPLGDLTGDIFRLSQEAKSAGEARAHEILSYVHERICRARHEISGDPIRALPSRPVFEPA